jgi:hypothetical protein
VNGTELIHFLGSVEASVPLLSQRHEMGCYWECLLCKAVKFSCIFIKNKLFLRGSHSVDSSSHVSHLIMQIKTNTDCTCTEPMRMHLSWCEDAIRYLNFNFSSVSLKRWVLTVLPLFRCRQCALYYYQRCMEWPSKMNNTSLLGIKPTQIALLQGKDVIQYLF